MLLKVPPVHIFLRVALLLLFNKLQDYCQGGVICLKITEMQILRIKS